MSGQAVGTHADHLAEAHLHRQITIGERVEQRDQLPSRLVSVIFKRDRVERSWRRRIAIGVFDCSPHETSRLDDLFEDAVDRIAHPIGRLHDVVPSAAWPAASFIASRDKSGLTRLGDRPQASRKHTKDYHRPSG